MIIKKDVKTSIRKWGNVAAMVVGGLPAIIAPLADVLPKWTFGAVLFAFGLGNLIIGAIKTEFDREEQL